jgi:hypothetical protein
MMVNNRSEGNQLRLSLDLSKELADEGIIKNYLFDARDSLLTLELNHEYDSKTIASLLELEKWTNSLQDFRQKMSGEDISLTHIVMICDTLAENHERISKHVKAQKRNSKKRNLEDEGDVEDGKVKREFVAFKYSNEGKGDLHESVILEDEPAFLKYDDKTSKITAVPKIVEEVRTIIPPYKENYPAYSPYEFSSLDEVTDYLERAKFETIDSLYLQAKDIASDYNDQTEEQINLLAIDEICSYFQDRFSTVHYDVITGGNGSGKSAWGISFVSIAYRPSYLMDINAANIFRILGCIEIGQCTLVLDEAEKVCNNPDLVSILKSGYSPIGRVSRINDFSRQPEFFRPYCFKIIIAESIPNIREAKGFRDRSFEFQAYRGSPKFDIKEDLEAEIRGNVEGQRRLARLKDFRKLMLVYRLLHFKDPLPDIDLGFGGREKELIKSTIELFYGSKAQGEVESTLEHFLNARNENKDTGLEAVLYPMVWNLVLASKTGKIHHKDLWYKIVNDFGGVYDKDHRPNEYQSEDFGTIHRQQVGTILEHTFGGKREHSKNHTFTFEPHRLRKVGESYNIKNKIQTRLVISHQSHNDGNGEQVNTVNTLGGEYGPNFDKNKAILISNGPDSRGNSPFDDVKKEAVLSISCSPNSPVHPHQDGQEQEPDFGSVAKELRNVYDD